MRRVSPALLMDVECGLCLSYFKKLNSAPAARYISTAARYIAMLSVCDLMFHPAGPGKHVSCRNDMRPSGPDRAVMLHAEKLGMLSLQLALMQGTCSLQLPHFLCSLFCLPSHGCETCQCCRCSVSLPEANAADQNCQCSIIVNARSFV